MDRLVRVRKRKKPQILAVYHGVKGDQDLDKVEPSYYCTRIWIGVVPPEDVNGEHCPGYACAVGEVYDGDPMQRDRKRIVLDEGVCLDPADFSPKERLYYGIRNDQTSHPTLYTLKDAVLALKDLYWAEAVFVPPGNPRFFRFFQSTDGLFSYDSRYGDARYKRHQPFFVSRRRTCNGVFQVDHEERAHNLELVNSLLDTGLLDIYTNLTNFWDRRLPTAYRAIGLVCAEMQLHDMTYAIREMSFSDGYEDYDDTEIDTARKGQVQSQAEDLSWWANGTGRLGGSWLQ